MSIVEIAFVAKMAEFAALDDVDAVGEIEGWYCWLSTAFSRIRGFSEIFNKRDLFKCVYRRRLLLLFFF